MCGSRGQWWLVPDEPLQGDEVSALRAANARLRRVVEAQDTEVAAPRATILDTAVRLRA